MKKLFAFLILTLFVTAFAFAQQNSSAVQKHALVIGNGKYTNFGTLRNAVNDAEDVAAALASLGFSVDKVIDGNLSKMDNAAVNLKNKLSSSKNSYGFFFFAGHGVQHNGINYLIPVDANIPDSEYLRERAVSMQAILDMLNKSNNALNIIVLDACRDFPATWSRSADRGLAVVHPPTDSIIMYATAAGKTASDGTGRNGLFTSHLLTHLKTPGIEVNDLFRRTMLDVAKASGNAQRPALYTDFAEIAYLGSKPAAVVTPAAPVAPVAVTPTTPVATVPADNAALAKTHFDKGEEHRKNNKLDAAVSEYTKAINLNPDYPEAYYYRGNIYSSKQDYDNAIADYTKAINLNPDYPEAYYYRGGLYYSKKDYDKAIADYTQAINLNPNYGEAYNRRGVAYSNGKKDHDKAIADYTQVINLNPNNETAYHNRGSNYFVKKDYDKAIADYTQVINLNPNFDGAYYNRGRVYSEKGDYEKAIADYTKAIKLKPDYSYLYEHRGDAYKAKGDKKSANADYDTAIANYTKMIKLEPDRGYLYQWRGNAYKAKGDNKKADADYAKAKKLGYKP